MQYCESCQWNSLHPAFIGGGISIHFWIALKAFLPARPASALIGRLHERLSWGGVSPPLLSRIDLGQEAAPPNPSHRVDTGQCHPRRRPGSPPSSRLLSAQPSSRAKLHYPCIVVPLPCELREIPVVRSCVAGKQPATVRAGNYSCSIVAYASAEAAAPGIVP